MGKAKAGLRGMNALDKQARACVIYDSMVGNPSFPTPSPSMLEFGQALEELKAANLDAGDRGRRAIFRRDQAEEVISEMITRLVGYVNAVSAGNTSKILSAGFNVAKRPEPISQLAEPRIARAKSSPLPNQLNLRWSRVPGAIMYMVEETTGGTFEKPEWTMVQLTSDHRTVLHGKDKSQPCTFRVHAIGRRTKSPMKLFYYTIAA